MRHTLSTLDDVQARYAWFQQMRHTQPVWLDEHTGYWHVFRYADVEHVITDFSSFSSRGGATTFPQRWTRPNIVSIGI